MICDHGWVIPWWIPDEALIRAFNERFGHLNDFSDSLRETTVRR
jgi:hypothetical protein